MGHASHLHVPNQVGGLIECCYMDVGFWGKFESIFTLSLAWANDTHLGERGQRRNKIMDKVNLLGPDKCRQSTNTPFNETYHLQILPRLYFTRNSGERVDPSRFGYLFGQRRNRF